MCMYAGAGAGMALETDVHHDVTVWGPQLELGYGGQPAIRDS